MALVLTANGDRGTLKMCQLAQMRTTGQRRCSMPGKSREVSALRQMGGARAIARGLAQFQKAARALSSDHPRLIDKYPKQWVVVFDGEVKARGRTMKSALLQARKRSIPLEHAIVRYIDKNERTFIL